MRTLVLTLICATMLVPAPPALAAGDGAEPTEARPVSFRHDVMAVLSKAGCNAGTCHGSLNGKGGLKLSLRGEAPRKDYLALTKEASRRRPRVNVAEPEQSLVLLKPTETVSHEGGRRLNVASAPYRVLREWIAAAAPADPDDLPRLTGLEVEPREATRVAPAREVPLRVHATFSDGSVRDVTSQAVYEPAGHLTEVSGDGVVTARGTGEATVVVRYLHEQRPVRLAFIPHRPGFVFTAPPASTVLDRHVYTKLERLRINPSALCDDATFLRRATLDICGVLPTAAEARAFVADTAPDKRAKLVDRLLLRPEFADHWAMKWADLLRNEEKVLDTKGVKAFHGWIRDRIAEGVGVDRFVQALLSSRGSTYEHPPANYYRALRSPSVRAEATAQVFLGIRLQCAKCHNHPFERWTQDDYYGFAANFARVQYRIVENKRRDKHDKHQFIGEQIVEMGEEGEVKHPETGQAMAACFLGGDEDTAAGPHAEADAGGGTVPAADREAGDPLRALAAWVTAADNPWFARVQANRVWYHMMGRGVVDPIDDFRLTNPPVNPALLDALTEAFTESGFELRALVRLIATSTVYQLDSAPNATNRDDTTNFSHALVRRLPAEVLLDALAMVLDVRPEFNGLPAGLRAVEIPGVHAVYRDPSPSGGDRFLTLFGKPPRLLCSEAERSNETTLAQVFELTSGRMLDEMLREPDNRIGKLLQAGADDDAVLDELYWSALGRGPTDAEKAALLQRVAKSPDRRRAWEDVTWGLLNAKAFLLRH